MRSNGRTLCGVALCGLLVLLIAVLATRHLPASRLFESRYEFRLRDYQKNIGQPESVLNGLSLMDSYALCQYLSRQESGGCDVAVWCDNTEKLTIRVRHSAAEMAQQQALRLFSMACDTVQAFGDSMCARKIAVYQRQIDSLSACPQSDSLQSLVCDFRDRLAILQADAEGGMKYLEVLNPAEAGIPHKTPRRWLVVLVAVLASVVLSSGMALLKKTLSR